MKLLLEEFAEEYDSDDDYVLSDRVTITAHYAVCNMPHYLFREEYSLFLEFLIGR
jgi:hypothetical protein